MILYNVPGRTVADLATETTLRLAEVPGIVGIKDATADMGRGSELLKALARQDNATSRCTAATTSPALPLMLMGGHGVISVTANVAPKLMAQMCAAALAGDVATARECNNRLLRAASQALRRGEPDPDQVGAGRDGPHPQRTAAAARARCRRNSTRPSAPRCAKRAVSHEARGTRNECMTATPTIASLRSPSLALRFWPAASR